MDVLYSSMQLGLSIRRRSCEWISEAGILRRSVEGSMLLKISKVIV